MTSWMVSLWGFVEPSSTSPSVAWQWGPWGWLDLRGRGSDGESGGPSNLPKEAAKQASWRLKLKSVSPHLSLFSTLFLLAEIHIKRTVWKCSVQWHLVRSQCCAGTTSLSFQNISITPKGNAIPTIDLSPFPYSLVPHNLTSTFCLYGFTHPWHFTCVWVLSLLLFLRIICVVAWIGFSFLLIANSTTGLYKNLLVHFPTSSQLKWLLLFPFFHF